jgi:hypothetical protein
VREIYVGKHFQNDVHTAIACGLQDFFETRKHVLELRNL